MAPQKKKPYCSIGEVPKGQKRGSMKECADMKQIRYYGVKKIDSRTLEYSTNGNKKISKKLTGKKLTTDAEMSKIVAHARGKWAAFKRKIRDMDVSSLTETEKKKLRMEQTVLKNLLLVAEQKASIHKKSKQITSLKSSNKQSRSSKKGLRKSKSSKKLSRTKTSKKASKKISKRGSKRRSKRKSRKN